MVILKTRNQIDKLRTSNNIVAVFLGLVKEKVAEGTTTMELNILAEKIAKDHDAIAAFKGYQNFPYSICSSVDDQIVHGFPNNNPLQEGSILSVDFGIVKDGYYGDAAVTVPVGNIDDTTTKLLRTTRECLDLAITKAVPGGRLSDISNAIQTHAESNNFSVVRDYVGHSIGKELHESPQVPNYGTAGKGSLLKAGMTIAIEPMLTVGKSATKKANNGWEVYTADGSLACHFEHSVLITDNGCEILSEL